MASRLWLLACVLALATLPSCQADTEGVRVLALHDEQSRVLTFAQEPSALELHSSVSAALGVKDDGSHRLQVRFAFVARVTRVLEGLGAARRGARAAVVRQRRRRRRRAPSCVAPYKPHPPS